MLGAALGFLLEALALVSAGQPGGLQADGLPAQVLLALNTFSEAWNLALVVFAFSLLVAGYLAFKSGFVPKLLGILLIIAGTGYLVDGLGQILVTGYGANIGMFTFIGEPLFMVWLLWKGVRGFGHPQANAQYRATVGEPQ